MKNAVIVGMSLLILASGCSMRINGVNLAGIRGSGMVVTEVRELSDFSQVVYGGSASVRLVLGDTGKVEVTCDDNLLEYISTEVDGDTLRIRATTPISVTGRHHYEVTCPRINGLRVSGSASATVEEFASDRFELNMSGSGSTQLANVTSEELSVRTSGSGSVRVAGQVEALSIATSGSGSVNAQALVARSANVKTSGSGSVKVHVSEAFDGSTSGSGSIRCYGNPTHRSDSASGSGRVHFVD